MTNDPSNGWQDPAEAQTPVDRPGGMRPSPRWMSIAKLELGQHEQSGQDDNPRIQEYLKAVGLPFDHDETPWCSAFANWCMDRVGVLGTRRANARSWLSWGYPLDTPTYGCIVVFSRPPDPAHGHVAFYVDQMLGSIVVLGGNQANRVCIADYPRERLLGYRMPIDQP